MLTYYKLKASEGVKKSFNACILTVTIIKNKKNYLVDAFPNALTRDMKMPNPR